MVPLFSPASAFILEAFFYYYSLVCNTNSDIYFDIYQLCIDKAGNLWISNLWFHLDSIYKVCVVIEGIKQGDDRLEAEKWQLISVISEAADNRLIVSQRAKDK